MGHALNESKSSSKERRSARSGQATGESRRKCGRSSKAGSVSRSNLFPEQHITADQVVAEARSEYEQLHSLPIADPDERETILSGTCAGQPGVASAEAGDGRVVCGLVLAHR